MTEKCNGIVFKDPNWELQLFFMKDDFVTPLGLPSIPIGDSDRGITKQIKETDFYFVKFKALENDTTKKMISDSKDSGININTYELLCKSDYLIRYGFPKFELNTTVVESLKSKDFWKCVKHIHDNEKVTFNDS